jgi:uncharacterized protein (UPF0333 family)
MDEFNYYRTELEKINTKSEYPAQLKIKSESGETKWLSLNQESASEIVQFLTDKYLTK